MKVNHEIAGYFLNLASKSHFESLSNLSKKEKKTLLKISQLVTHDQELHVSKFTLNTLQHKLAVHEYQPLKKVDLDFILSVSDNLQINGMEFINEAFMEVLRQLPNSPLASIPHRTEFSRIQEREFQTTYQEITKERETIDTDVPSHLAPLLTELERFRDELGGAPNYQGRTLDAVDREDAGKYFLGIPLTRVKAWLRQALEKKYFPQFLWKFIARCFNVNPSSPETRFEYITKSIKRFDILLSNKDKFLEMYQTNNMRLRNAFVEATGLDLHLGLNGFDGEREMFAQVEHFLTTKFEEAKAQGDAALHDYFKAFQGLCHQARCRSIQEYNMTHGDIGVNATDIDSSQPAETAFNREFMALKEKNPGKFIFSRQEILDHLNEEGIFDREFTTREGTKQKPTPEQYHAWTLVNHATGVTEDFYTTDEFLEMEWAILKTKEATPTLEQLSTQVSARIEAIHGFMRDDVVDELAMNDEKIAAFFQKKTAA